MAKPSATPIADGLSITLGPLARALTRQYARILMYHRFSAHARPRRLSASVFEEHLRYITRHFTPRPLRDVVDRLRSRRSFDSRSVVLTVDDGYRDFLEHAYPLLLRYRVPATIYVVTEFAAGRCWLWFDALHWLLSTATPGRYRFEVDAQMFELMLETPAAREATWSKVGTYLWDLSPEAQWSSIRRLESLLGVQLPARPTTEYAPMTWDELRGLDPELIEIGSHSCTHAVLSRCTSAQQLTEIATSKKTIEERLGRRVDAFCYPHGRPQDFTAETESIAADCGFTSAVVAFGGLVGATSPPGRLTRLSADDELRLFRNSVNGIGRIKQALRIPD
ncbi:MAG TPA: polysaccharide deacetylase family protein [Steroidobacteraceae bacterium]|nr:polysaccharide deacetylase family protein [Steroidobacteraceae bacterium]